MAESFITAGQRNRRVAIQQEQTTRQAQGSPSTTWSTVQTVWASIDIQNSSLVYETSAFMEQVIYRITMLYSRSLQIDTSKRLQYVDAATGITHNYRINSVVNTATANREIVLLCTEFGGSE